MPRESTFVVFDEYLPKTTNGVANSVFTGTQFNTQLGRSNQIAVHAVFDNITPGAAARNLYCYLDVSNDGRNWIQRSNPTKAGGAYAAGDADITIAIATTDTGPLQGVFSDVCQGISRQAGSSTFTGPLLGLVRLRCFFDGTGDVAGHLRISVTQRDR
jgi:hypothetical protein